MSNQTAILVDCCQIINWLQQRKKLNKNWYDHIKAAQQMIKILLRSYQADFATFKPIIELIRFNQDCNNEFTSAFTYCDVCSVVQLLLQSQLAKQKNILFGYSDSRVKKWIQLSNYLQKNQTGLILMSKNMNQIIKFQIPSLSKGIDLIDVQVINLKRKIDFNNNVIFQQEKDNKSYRSSLRITNFDNSIEQQIPIMIARTPIFMKELQVLCDQYKISKLVQMYYHNLELHQIERKLEILQFFIKYGNVFIEEYNNRTKKQQQSNNKYQDFLQWKVQNEWEIEVQGQQIETSNCNRSIETVLQNIDTRQQLILDFNELLYFLKGLQHSNKSKSIIIENDGIKMVTSQISESIQHLEEILSELNSPKLIKAIEIKNNKKAYQLLITEFRIYQKTIERMKNQIQSYQKQINQLVINRQKQVKKLDSLRFKVIKIKKICEKMLGDSIGRQIKITGEVNKMQ